MDVGGKNITMKCPSIQMSYLVTNEQQIHSRKMMAEDPLVHSKLCDGVMTVG